MYPTINDVHIWAESLEEIHHLLRPRFARAEPRERAMAYLRGLLSTTQRKNGWQLAELAGEATPDGMQRLLSTAQWDADAVRDDLQQYVMAHLHDPQAVLVIDETGFLKKGTKSAGVAPQYSGTAGRLANSQIGVFLAYATPEGPALIDRALYLPHAWVDDPARCREAGIPQPYRHHTKQVLALAMLDHAYANGVTAGWMTADSLYGGDFKVRQWLEAHQQAFVVAVPRNQRIGLAGKAELVAARWPEEVWQRLSAGEGSQGPRGFDWAWMPMSWRDAPHGWQHWLLARRSLTDPTDLAYFFVFAPTPVTLAQVVQVAGTRWQVEEAFELAKQHVGLDEYEVRHWDGWYRHITFAMLALAFLTVIKVAAQKRGTIGSKRTPKHSSR